MDTPGPNKQANSQEQIAGALGAFLFVIPPIMGQKTEFTLFYMRQNFLIILCMMIFVIIGKLISFFATVMTLLNILLFFLILFLMWKAYSGEKFAVPYLYDMSIKVIKILKLDGFFSTK
ncbi:hypothetical protein CSB09_01410 [Candidatus Gracilibacteria bacterium]|nr:MAG: hypothetical protein CSB09_01410 [Candidatus Gracilibacteria bacterium]